ncbi:MAG: NADPH-dependent 7-cyano-7-deazaguanine reductase QueF [Pseudomonadales bacterium]|nr:NADPH-dependent 7-cyano-7-deazaguanine reductase QueF [Pseudomonadales bacterium]
MGNTVSNSPLGKTPVYEEVYNPSLLFAIPRAEGRRDLNLNFNLGDDELPFSGVDIWNAYEMSWLNLKGKPEVGVCEIHVPCQSFNIIESKSLKLYLASFNQTSFKSREDVIKTIVSDLSITAREQVMVKVVPANQCDAKLAASFPGTCIDLLDVSCNDYEVKSELLRVDAAPEQLETLYSHLLKSNCPVTGQPDWATLMVRYRGQPISQESLLQYIVSYRNHSGFHEQCVEGIFIDILNQCKPSQLTVYARYTRRGGIDINPFRSNFEAAPSNIRLMRQ